LHAELAESRLVVLVKPRYQWSAYFTLTQ
jgi:hypothetical protein